MNKTELIRLLSKHTNTTIKESSKMLNTLLDLIVEAMQRGEEVNLAGFGKFWAKYYKSTLKKLPNYYNLCAVSPKFVPKFRPSIALKRRFLYVFG